MVSGCKNEERNERWDRIVEVAIGECWNYKVMGHSGAILRGQLMIEITQTMNID